MGITYLQRYNVAEYDRAITALYAQLPPRQSETQILRLEQISAYFLGQPYILGALGEGESGRFDQSPLYRTDGFDCVTYVNTVLALFYAGNLSEFKNKMAELNYRNAQVSYQNRHHFMCIDWNKANAQLGLIEDVTHKIVDSSGLSVAMIAQALIDRPNWLHHRQLSDLKLLQPLTIEQAKQRLTELHDLADQLSIEQSNLPYLPFSKLFDAQGNANLHLFSQIPAGAIIEIVRPNWDLRQQIGTYLNISHAGFIFRNKNTLIFREASSLLKQVCDVPLIDYLQGYLTSTTIKGINIQTIKML